ncbi:acyl-CoA dehydrogenase family protein [Amycolatopsis sp. Poz14]|uniref:acyl-CoA dehydrogenase family protein n=1 Tax=Amycolatopsis sp. Poz14 TaxID=1447705 RepID=UPI001EE910C6|nr:acyl-CoA dehydrogenase family protein [Amycolatopsis sp. Poz14]
MAAEQLGIAQQRLDTTVAYLKQGRQFGRVVGGFQALKHRLSDLYAEIERGAAASRHTAATLAVDDPDARTADGVAQAFCGDLAVRAAEEADSCAAASA